MFLKEFFYSRVEAAPDCILDPHQENFIFQQGQPEMHFCPQILVHSFIT